MNFVLAIFSIILLQTQVYANSEDIKKSHEKGSQTYINYCANCHGDDGKGDGPNAKQLAAKASDLTLLSKNNGGSFPETAVYNIIDGRRTGDYHGQEMPVWGQYYKEIDGDEAIVDARISRIIEYLKSIQVD